MSWMIDNNDPARLEIVKRAVALGIDGHPDKAAHALGKITVLDGQGGTKEVNAHVVHAVDPIITDGEFVVMINRSREPGLGKPCLPGGFIDPTKGGGPESALQAAAREALEEVGIKLEDNGEVVGKRNMNRPFDVRVAQNDMPQYGIKKDDVFMVSTQAVRFHAPDLKNTKLTAGDDAAPGSARLVEISSLSREAVGIPDHFDMIKEAFPGKFAPAPTPEEQAPGRNDGKSWIQSLGERLGAARAKSGNDTE